jgi:hypothetical protein
MGAIEVLLGRVAEDHCMAQSPRPQTTASRSFPAAVR